MDWPMDPSKSIWRNVNIKLITSPITSSGPLYESLHFDEKIRQFFIKNSVPVVLHTEDARPITPMIQQKHRNYCLPVKKHFNTVLKKIKLCILKIVLSQVK